MTAHIATSAAKNATLTDTAVMILSAAARRNDRLLFPLPKSMTSSPKIVKKTIEGLISKSLAEERPAKLQDTVWREDEEERKFTVLITDQGIAALESPPVDADQQEEPRPLAKGRPKAQIAPRTKASRAKEKNDQRKTSKGKLLQAGKTRKDSKAGQVLNLLGRSNGATIAEMMKATGWQPTACEAFFREQ